MTDFFKTVFSSIGIIDIIDIAIVAFLVYELIAFIKKTGSQQIIKGLFVLVVVFFLSELFGLNTLHWILKSIMAVGIIAVVVVMQPEIRRALEYFGKVNFSGIAGFSADESEKIIREYTAALKELADTKTGALIVIERRTALDNRINTGTVLDAEISAQLFGNIFYKGAPLHDGAVIIRKDRIYAAGCVLPLTENTDLDKSLGTRHRAGIGITENTDAVSLIVSEETGVISVAEGGKIVRYLDENYLRKVLSDIYVEKEKRRRSFFRRGGGDRDAE